MKDLVLLVVGVAIVCLVNMAASDKPAYRDVLEKIKERLEERVLEDMTNNEDTDEELTETQRLERLLNNLENKGVAGDIPEEKKMFQETITDFRPVCLPYTPLQHKCCCEPGFTYIDLTNGASYPAIDTASGIEVVEGPTVQRTSEDCSKMALLKINFEKVTKRPCPYCVRKPLCGRRMLRIDLNLSAGTRSGFTFNIGDSRTNNGYAGDSGTQGNDAEADGIFPNVRVMGSDKCDEKNLKVFSNAIGSAVNTVTIYVSNEHIRVTNDQGFDDFICHKCLYALNGQSDSEGPINEDVYVGLNRVIQYTARSGVGVCSAILSWDCPH